MITDEGGARLVRIAREYLKSYFSHSDFELSDSDKDLFSERSGLFVTLHKDSELRGCIGFIEPIYMISEGIIKAAKSAAFGDPRFTSLTEEELESVTIEVSVLTKPEIIEVDDPHEYLEKIHIGKDGLIVEHGFNKGLLLPVVAIEWGWGPKTFLDHTCQKAGLTMDAWQDKKTKVSKFQTLLFSETEPCGKIKRKM